MRRVISIVVMAATAAGLSAAQTVLIRNATVLTVTKGTIENASVLIENGKIAAIGKNVSAPSDATVVDATGKYLMPGIIDCHSHTAIEGGVNEGTVSDSSMVNIKDVLNPSDINIYRGLAGGLTVSNVLHGSANAIGGQTIVIKLRWGKPANELIFEGAKPGIKFALGENPKRAGEPQQVFTAPGAAAPERRYPGTRMGVEEVIRESFTEAKNYQAEWKEYNERVARGEHPIPPRKDLRLEPLVEVLEGKRYVHAHSYRADEILMLIRVADEMGFKIRTFQHVLEGYKVAKEIAEHGAGASTFSDWWAYKAEAYDATPYNAAIMTRKGVVVSLNSDSDELQRHLNLEAAKVMRYGGMTETQALAMVTINPAKQLGIDDKVGSIEVGKSGDLVLTDQDPLSNFSKVLKVWIDGHEYFDRDKDLETRPKFQEQKKELLQKENAAQNTGAEAGASGWSKLGQRKPAENGGDSMKAIKVLGHRSGVCCAGALLAAAENNSILIRNVTIHPVTAPVIQNGSILVIDGKIADIGPRLAARAGTRVIDGHGLQAYPGMINAATNVGLSEISAERDTVDSDEIGTFNPELRAEIAFNPSSAHVDVTRASGITTVISLPGSGGRGGRGAGGSVITGQAALMHLEGWTWEEMAVKPSVAMDMLFPQIQGGGRQFAALLGAPTRSYAEEERQYKEQLVKVSEFFDQARAYERAKAAGGPDFRTDIKMEAMIPVIDGKLPLFVRAERERMIKDALEFADKEKVKIIIADPREIGSVGPELKAKNVPVVLGKTFQLPMHDDDPYDAPYTLPSEFYKAGVKLCFGTFDVEFARNVPFEAAQAVAFGLPHDEAFKALTINSAQILGVGDQLGSIDKGKIADLILTDGDPMEAKTNIKQMFIAGREVSLESRHTQEYEKWIKRP